MTSIFDQGLDKNIANFVALSPVSFVERSAEIFGDLPAVIHGKRRYNWAQTRERSARLAAALKSKGIGRGNTVSAMLPNIPEMVEVHYAVPALNAVLNTLNTRLDAALIAWQLHHCESQVLITDREYAPVIAKALDILKKEHGRDIVVIDVCDSEYTGPGETLGHFEYEAWIDSHAPIATLNYHYYEHIDEVHTYIEQHKEQWQCIASNMSELKQAVGLGQTQKPGLSDYADNVNLLEFLS